MKHTPRATGLAVLSLACTAAPAQNTAAPTPTSGDFGVLQEIVVTAQKRSESVQDIGLSITALTAEQIDALNVGGAKDLVNYVSGVMVNDNFGAYSSYVIRGIGQNDLEANTSPSAALYVDEVYQANTIAGSPLVFDLERVEILKGPQGTLYGRNSSSGAISFISKRPTDAFEASAKLGVSQYSRYELEAAVSGPLTDSLKYRLSGKGINQEDSPYDLKSPDPARPVAGGEAFAPEDYALRGQLLWDAGDRTSVLLLSHYARQAGVVSNWIAIPTAQIPGGPTCPGRAGPPDAQAREGCQAGLVAQGFVRPPRDKFAVSVNFLEPLDNTFYGASIHASHELPFATLTSISAYEQFTFFRNWDEDGTVIEALNIQEDIDFDQISQELRLAGQQGQIDWILGALYSDDSYRNVRHLYAGRLDNGLGSINYVGAPGRVGTTSPHFPTRLTTANNLFSDLTQETRSAAIYTDQKLELADGLFLIGGYRFTSEKRRFFGHGSVIFTDGTMEPANQNNVGAAVGDEEIETKRSSGRLGINWQPDPGKLFYLLFSEGFKSGGFDGGPASNVEVTFAPYQEEIVRSLELGFKTDWQRLRINGAVFVSEYDQPQAKIRRDVLAADGVTIIPQTQLGNLDKAEVRGAELETLWRPLDGLTLSATGTFLDTELSASGFAQPLFDGNPLAFAPKFSGTLGLQYEWKIGGLVALLGVDGKYVGKHYLRPEQFAIDEEEYTLVNARAALGSDSGRWQVELFGKNIADEQYRMNAAGSFGADVFAVGLPATWGVALRIKL